MPKHHTPRILAAAGTFLLLAIVHTWPLAADPSHWSRIDNGDAALNVWAVNWVGYHLPRAPWRLAEGNILHPEHLTLAYSEMMIVQGIIAMPVVALGGSPVLAYNVALLAGFALTGVAFCLLLWRWTGSWTAGYVAGSMAAFNAHTLVRLAHLQAQHVEFVALMLFALDRLLAMRRFRDAMWLGLGFALQGLTSLYLLVFSTWLLLFAALARARDWLRAAMPMVLRFAAAAAVALLILAPYLATYYRLHQVTGFSRAADEVASGELTHYLATGSRLHYERWSRPFGVGAISWAFPGFVGASLAIAAWSQRENRADPRVRMVTAAGLGCFLVSLAPKLPFYPAVHEAIPLFQAVRQLAHIAGTVLLMIAVIAGFGVAGLERRWRQRRGWPAVAIALVAIVNVEALRAPVGFTRFNGIPPAYDALAAERTAVVIEMPFPAPQQWHLNGPYMVYSTRHWHSIRNGYSGFRPKSYYDSYDAAQDFPSDASLISLYRLGVTHIVVHHHAFMVERGVERFHAIAQQHSLQYVSSDEDTTVYRLLTP